VNVYSDEAFLIMWNEPTPLRVLASGPLYEVRDADRTQEPDREPLRARRAWESHPARAEWMTARGYQRLLRNPHYDARQSRNSTDSALIPSPSPPTSDRGLGARTEPSSYARIVLGSFRKIVGLAGLAAEAQSPMVMADET
jgi:hypothetical protein